MNEYITRIEDLEFLAGDTITFRFDWFYENGHPINLVEMGATVFWTLCPYGQYEYPLLTKDMTISDEEPHNITTVTLYKEETENLDDIKYSHQPVVRYEQRDYRRAEGDLLILPRIQND